jgi:hypothetical protein
MVSGHPEMGQAPQTIKYTGIGILPTFWSRIACQCVHHILDQSIAWMIPLAQQAIPSWR